MAPPEDESPAVLDGRLGAEASLSTKFAWLSFTNENDWNSPVYQARLRTLRFDFCIALCCVRGPV